MTMPMTTEELIEDSALAPYSDVCVVEPEYGNNEIIEKVEGGLLQFPQVDIPLTHLFAPGVYWREVFMPAGTFVIGHQHKTSHFNVILSGSARVMMDGELHQITAPCVLVSEPNVRKLLYIEEDMRWATVHPTEETDLEALSDLLITKSGTFLGHEKELLEFRQMLGEGEIL